MKSTPNPNTSFIQKLLIILEDPECQPYIEWLDSENGFNIVNVSGFSMHVLPIYFKHQNFSSFVRQLNMYGFAKVRGKDGENVYEHKYFKRGSKASIKKIQRKIASEPYSRGNELVLYKPSILCEKRKKQGEIEKLREKQVELEKKCHGLLETNRQLLEENQSILKEIKEEEVKKKRLLDQIISIISGRNSGDNLLAIQPCPNQKIRKRPSTPTPYHSHSHPHKSPQQAEAQMKQTTNISHQYKEQLDHNHNHDQKQEIPPLNILDPNQSYLKLDDFLNIDYDQLSQVFKL